MALRASALTAPLVASLPARGLSRARLSAGAMSRLSPVAAAVSDAPTSATDNDFSGYVPKTAFLFPGQGAQAVGMAKVRAETRERSPQPPRIRSLAQRDAPHSQLRGWAAGGSQQRRLASTPPRLGLPLTLNAPLAR